MIGKLLGHGQVESTARYAHLARDSTRESASRVADSIAADLLVEDMKSCASDSTTVELSIRKNDGKE